eukprot:2424684-Pyramimonas_sp.AAC.1
MQAQRLRPPVKLSLGGHETCARGVPSGVRRCHPNAATGNFDGQPCGTTKRARGVPKQVRRCHANTAAGAFGGAPYGASETSKGCAWHGGAMRRQPLSPSMEMPRPHNV